MHPRLSRYHVAPQPSGPAVLAYRDANEPPRLWPIEAVWEPCAPGRGGFLKIAAEPLPVLPTAPPQHNTWPPDLPTC